MAPNDVEGVEIRVRKTTRIRPTTALKDPCQTNVSPVPAGPVRAGGAQSPPSPCLTPFAAGRGCALSRDPRYCLSPCADSHPRRTDSGPACQPDRIARNFRPTCTQGISPFMCERLGSKALRQIGAFPLPLSWNQLGRWEQAAAAIDGWRLVTGSECRPDVQLSDMAERIRHRLPDGLQVGPPEGAPGTLGCVPVP